MSAFAWPEVSVQVNIDATNGLPRSACASSKNAVRIVVATANHNWHYTRAAQRLNDMCHTAINFADHFPQVHQCLGARPWSTDRGINTLGGFV
jgi:hypothetical protein